MKKSTRAADEGEQGLASFHQAERGAGGWPTDPQVAFIEAKYKLDKARKEAARWRSNHANLQRRLRHLEGAPSPSLRPRAPQGDEADSPATWRLSISDKHIELYTDLVRKPRAISSNETRMLLELVDAWRDLEHRKHIALQHLRG